MARLDERGEILLQFLGTPILGADRRKLLTDV
jgi:hypothetical protein